MNTLDVSQYLTNAERERACSVRYYKTSDGWRSRRRVGGLRCCPLGMAFPELACAAPTPTSIATLLTRTGRVPTWAWGAPLRTLTAFAAAIDGGDFQSEAEIYAALGCAGPFHPSSS